MRSVGMLALPGLTTVFVAALFALRYRTTTLPSLPVHTKIRSFVSWSGPACPPVSPARAPAAACCPSLPAVRLGFRLSVSSFHSGSLSSPAFPLSAPSRSPPSSPLPLLGPVLSLPLPLFLLRPAFLSSVASASSLSFFGFAFGLAGSVVVVVVVCGRSAGLRLFLCLPVSSLP